MLHLLQLFVVYCHHFFDFRSSIMIGTALSSSDMRKVHKTIPVLSPYTCLFGYHVNIVKIFVVSFDSLSTTCQSFISHG